MFPLKAGGPNAERARGLLRGERCLPNTSEDQGTWLGGDDLVQPLGASCCRPGNGRLLKGSACGSLGDMALHDYEDDDERECRRNGEGHHGIPPDGVLAEELSEANGDRCPCRSASQDAREYEMVECTGALGPSDGDDVGRRVSRGWVAEASGEGWSGTYPWLKLGSEHRTRSGVAQW